MKKLLSFAALSALVLASCSNENEATVPAVDENAPVPVVLGTKAPELTTRASLGSMANLPITVWGLAKNTDDWTSTEAQLFDLGNGTKMAYMNATVGADGETVTWENSVKYYYPFETEKNFSFFACYPDRTKGTDNLEADQLTMTYTIDGKTDVLWGRVQADPQDNQDNYDGFNATYIRKVLAPVDQNPAATLSFEHMLVKFIFKIIPGDSDANLLDVSDVALLNVPDKISIKVADLASASANAYTLGADRADSFVPETEIAGDAANVSISLYDKEDDTQTATLSLENVTVGDEGGEQIGESIMVPVRPGQESYDMQIKFMNRVTRHPFEPENLKIEAPIKNGIKEFKCGSSYEVQLKVYGEKEVVVKANLRGWVDEDPIPMPDLN